jgi:hypothetical protein
VQYADRVHQLLDRHRRMIDLPLCDQIIQHKRRSILQLIYIHKGIEQKALPGHPACVDKRKLVIASTRQSFLGRTAPNVVLRRN